MQNAFDEVQRAVSTAKEVERACRTHAAAMADLLVGNLDCVSHSTLKKLKKELARYNIHTCRWRAPR